MLVHQETPPTLKTLTLPPAHLDFVKYTLILEKRLKFLLNKLVKCRLNDITLRQILSRLNYNQKW